jgi:hypothetical protein
MGNWRCRFHYFLSRHEMEGELSALSYGRFPPGKEPPVLIELNRTLRGPRSRFEQFREGISLLSTPTIEPRFLRSPACSLVTISTELSQLEIGYL